VPRSAPGDLLVAGHTVVDTFWDVRALPQSDRTVPVVAVRAVLGGTAANIARAAAARGVRTGLLSRVGPDFPPEFRRELARFHLDLRGLSVVAGQRSPTCLIVEDGKGHQMTLIDQGAMADASDADVPASLLASYPWVHITTGDPEYQLRVAAAVRAAGGRVAADPAQEVHYRWRTRPLARLLAASELFLGNESEARATADRLSGGSVERLTKRVPLVVVTRGRRGARAYSRRGTINVPGRAPRRLRQVTGAGDTFRGGFYAAFLRGATLEASLREGVEAATDWIETGAYPSRTRR
jgi:nucleoside kinase